MAVKIAGVLMDIPKAERGFTHFSSETRANMMASHRLGFRQRERVCEVWWTHPFCPGVCFPTSADAYHAALLTLSSSSND